MQFDILAVNLLFALLGGLVILVFSKANYSLNIKRLQSSLFILSFGAINGIISTILTYSGDLAQSVKPIVLLALSIATMKIILKISLPKSILAFVLFAVSMGIGDITANMILGLFHQGSINYIYENAYFLINLIVFIITTSMMLLVLPFRHLIKVIASSKELIFVCILTFLIITANFSLRYLMKVYDLLTFLIILALTVIYLVYIVFLMRTVYRSQAQKAEIEQQSFYNKSLENSLFNLRRFKHDWGNNMAVINAMLAMNKFEEAKAYLHEIIDFNEKSNNTLLYNIKNAGLFGIISAKQNLALNKGIRMEINGSGEISDIPGIKISELCEILGILLDNAIEESEKVNEKIELNYSIAENSIEISIKNKCKEEMDLSKLGKESSKGADRGNGLQIVEQIIKRNKNVENYRLYEADTKTFEQLLVIEKGL